MLLEIINKIDRIDVKMADKIDRLIFSQTTPTDVYIDKLIASLPGKDRAELRKILHRIMSLRGIYNSTSVC